MMVVMFVGMCAPNYLHRAVHVVLIAAFHFHLDGGVTDSEVVIQLLLDRPQHLFTASNALFGHHNVTATADHAGPYRPNMAIMARTDAVNLSAGVLHLRHPESSRYGFTQYIPAL